MKLTFLALLLVAFALTNLPGQSLNGTYTLTTEEATLTLSLQEEAGGIITGSLQSSLGVTYRLQGEIHEGVAMGVCTDNQSGVYFEASLEANSLTLGLIEPDQFNMPDYNTARYIIFEKQQNPGVNRAQGSIIDNLTTGKTQVSPQHSSGNTQPSYNNSQPVAASSKVGEGEGGDPTWGWKFLLPQGWQSQKNAEGVYLGHNTIAGLIMVLPHMSENMQQLQQEMINGISEEGNYLRLDGTLETAGNGILAGEYSGVMDGTQVKARGIGTLSPFGGGAFVIAVTTPDKYGNELKNTAGSIAKNMSYFKPATGDLVQYFAGKWTNYTKNTSTYIALYPNGSYGEQYESSYSGDLSGGGTWGTAGQSDRAGRWTVRGNKEQGQIIVKLNNGNEIIYNYRVHTENGQVYPSEYYFNGSLYGKSRIE